MLNILSETFIYMFVVCLDETYPAIQNLKLKANRRIADTVLNMQFLTKKSTHQRLDGDKQ